MIASRLALDALRLGLKLALRRRDEEPSGRTIYLDSRTLTVDRFAALVRDAAPDLTERSVALIATYAIAGADGLFIAREIDGDAIDFTALFELHARLIFTAAIDIVAADEKSRSS
ncbi:hypothetical protein ACWDTI_23100 [Gordonia sp. NPDC003424]